MSPAKNTLEVLRVAEASLTDEANPYVYMDPSSCTCGHLYAAFLHETPGDVDGIYDSSHDEVYGQVVREVATVLGWEPDSYYADNHRATTEDALWFISDKTYTAVNPEDASVDEAEKPVDRDAALIVIREAISKIEGHEEQARLQVAA